MFRRGRWHFATLPWLSATSWWPSTIGGGISGGRTPVRRRWLLGTSAWLAATERPTQGSEVGREFPPLGQETRGFVGGFTYRHSVDVAEAVASCANIMQQVSRVFGYCAALGRHAICCKAAPHAPPAAKARGQATVVTASGGAAACRGRTGGALASRRPFALAPAQCDPDGNRQCCGEWAVQGVFASYDTVGFGRSAS